MLRRHLNPTMLSESSRHETLLSCVPRAAAICHRFPLNFCEPAPRCAARVLLSVQAALLPRLCRSGQAVNDMTLRDLADRVRGEFNEMPGLQLTIPQAARLWGMEPDACRDVVETLIDASFLRKTEDGTIVRVAR